MTGEKTETDRTSVIIPTHLNRTLLLQQQYSFRDFVLPTGSLGGGDTVALAINWTTDIGPVNRLCKSFIIFIARWAECDSARVHRERPGAQCPFLSHQFVWDCSSSAHYSLLWNSRINCKQSQYCRHVRANLPSQTYNAKLPPITLEIPSA